MCLWDTGVWCPVRGESGVLVLMVGVFRDAAPTSPSAPRLAVTEKFTSLVSLTLAGESAVMPCAAQAHPVPRYRYAPAVHTGSGHCQPRYGEVPNLVNITGGCK